MEENKFEKLTTERLQAIMSHLVNLNIPLNNLSAFFSDSKAVSSLVKALQTPITIDDEDFQNSLCKLFTAVSSFKKQVDSIDIVQSLNEIKYIGKRLNKIESILECMQEEGIKKKINLSIDCDGYELVKKTDNYMPDDNISLPIDPYELENKILQHVAKNIRRMMIHKLGFHGKPPVTYQHIGILLEKEPGFISRKLRSQIGALHRNEEARLLCRSLHNKILNEFLDQIE